MSFDELVRMLNRGSRVPILHAPAFVAPLLHFLGPKLPQALIEIMISDSRSDHPDAQSAFGLSLHHLKRIWSEA